MRRRNDPPDRLTRDVMAAHAAGMSYGKWKADHPNTRDPEVDDVPNLDDGRKELTCAHCEKIFVAYGHETKRKYCSDECRRIAVANRYRETHPRVMVPCEICGKDMPRRSRKRFCSKACGVEAFRRKQEEEGGKPRKKREKAKG